MVVMRKWPEKTIWSGLALLVFAMPAGAQQVSFVHRLGNDTIAVEQYTRTGNRIAGELVSRQGAAVTRAHYEVTLSSDGRPASAIYRTRNAAGAPLPNAPSEIRLTFQADSVKREAVFADSTNTRTVPAARAVLVQNPAFGLNEIALAQFRRANTQSLQLAVVNSGGNPGTLTLTSAGGDSVRASNGFIYRADREGRLLAVDGSNTTQKIVSTRSTDRVDIAAIASRLAPTGVLSARGFASASFLQSVVFVNYSRPRVRERTVWGGLLIPHDTIWRAGANEATHLATSRELTFGNVVVPPGLYTLFIFNSRANGPQLVINKQVGQWGTVYTEANDLARIPMTMAATPEHVEEYTINVRNLAADRGALEFAWGSQAATAAFTVRR